MLKAGDRAPPFELPDLRGERLALGDVLASGPVLAVFWKPACGTCHMAFPYLQRLHDAYPREGWRLLAVSQDDEDSSQDFADEYGLSFPVLIEGPGYPASRQYDPDATPTLFLIDRDGMIEETSVGFSKEELNRIAARIAEHIGVAPALIARADDGNPPAKPG